jgi:hypothetical protein
MARDVAIVLMVSVSVACGTVLFWAVVLMAK